MQTLILPAACDRAAASALHLELSDALGTSPLPIDASKVEKIGQAMLQLLISASKSESGIAITASSEVFRQALTLTGLERVLMEEPQ